MRVDMKKTIKCLLTVIGTVAALSTTALTAFAEGSADANVSQSTPGQTLSPGSSLLYYGGMILLFLVVGYFFMIRPEKKRKKEAETLRDNLRPGNRITSIGGIVGTVEKVTDDDIYLTNGLVLKRWALRTIDETAPEGGNAAVTYYEEDEDDK